MKTTDNKIACSDSGHSRMSRLQYDAFFTWNDYHGLSDPKEAIFIWNGTDVGKGARGLSAVINNLEQLREGSAVLVFPTFETDIRSGNPPYRYPFMWGQMEPIMKAKKLVVEISNYDNNGKYVGATKVSRRRDYMNGVDTRKRVPDE